MAATKSSKTLLLLLLLLLRSLIPAIFLVSPSLAATTNNSTLFHGGPSLNSTSAIVSPNGLFTLELRRLGYPDSNSSYLGIRNSNDTDFCWTANRDSPIPDDSGQLSIDLNGTLKLTFSAGLAVVLYSGSSRQNQRSIAVLEDTGNFALRDDVSGELLWQSFDHPADSWLQGMKLGTVVNAGIGQNRKLTSWLTRLSPATGAFTLEWDPAGEQLVMKRRGAPFWASGKSSPSPSATAVSSNYSFGIGLVQNYFNATRVSSSDEGDYLILEAPRIFRLTHLGEFEDQSFGFASATIGSPCDGEARNEYGCLSWEGPECRRSRNRFVELEGGFKNGSWKQINNGSLSFSDCREICWNDCECGGLRVDLYDGFGPNGNDTGCQLFYGYGGFTEFSTTRFSDRFDVIVDGAYGKPIADSSSNVAVRIWVPLAAVAALAMFVVCLYLYRRRRKLRERVLAELLAPDGGDGGEKTGDGDDGDRGHHMKVYSVGSIMAATDNFSLRNKLGQGGFGPVYKGKLLDGREVAVKRLSKTSGQGLVEFRNELVLIAKVQHMNLVRLLGCCIHGEEKMLVYEYMPNKSLDSFIFSGEESKRLLLDWSKRFDIIEGIAQGLLYLHKYSRVTIVHRDLKVGNVLLDEDLNPKISDFGLARIFNTNASEATTNRPVGTYGYMSPEYAMDGTFSTKSDIFSFGVMLLEIVSGRKNYSLVQVDPPINLVGYAWKLRREGTPIGLMDPTLRDPSTLEDQVVRCINVALLCIEYNAYDRPTMSEVISMIAGEVPQLPMPKQPAFTMMRPKNTEQTSSTKELEICSTNEVTVTTMSGR